MGLLPTRGAGVTPSVLARPPSEGLSPRGRGWERGAAAIPGIPRSFGSRPVFLKTWRLFARLCQDFGPFIARQIECVVIGGKNAESLFWLACFLRGMRFYGVVGGSGLFA